MSIDDVLLYRMLAFNLLSKLASGDLLLEVHVQFFNRGSLGLRVAEVDKDNADE